MLPILRGRYRARLAQDAMDITAAQRLRWLCFVGHRDPARGVDGIDRDDLDARCQHMLIEDTRTGQLVGCFRFLEMASGADIDSSYSAQFYDLARLRDYPGRMIEMGRFCIHPAHSDPDILRIAWGALTGHVLARQVDLLFGCSSFMGTDTEPYKDSFAVLRQRHLAPKKWLPRAKAQNVFRFARALRLLKPDARRAQAGMPPLLRSYLMMGGWVSDHAVVDTDLNTLHVFTGLEIRAIPPARVRLLQGI